MSKIFIEIITKSQNGQLTTIELGFLIRSHEPVGCLACPARFEHAAWALGSFTEFCEFHRIMAH